MAYLELKSGKKTSISAEQGAFLWKALRNPSGLDEELLEKVQGIKAIYLAWRNAPDDYIRENLKGIVPIALNDWAVDRRTGRPTRPQSDHAWKFAKRWGLWENGGPSLLVTDPAAFTQTTLAGSLEVDD